MLILFTLSLTGNGMAGQVPLAPCRVPVASASYVQMLHRQNSIRQTLSWRLHSLSNSINHCNIKVVSKTVKLWQSRLLMALTVLAPFAVVTQDTFFSVTPHH